MVAAQLDAVAEDLRPAACKSGMLANEAVVRIVADRLAAHALPNYVLDPVMVATSGDVLLEPGAVASIRDALLPLARLVTPNLPEAALLVDEPLRTPDDMVAAARALVGLGARAALVKGGHLDGDTVLDVLCDGGDVRHFRHPRITTSSLHGTGCTLSAAIAAGMARGRPLGDAVSDALEFVHRAIATAPGLGGGHGPLNHWA
jgi:hydroxymethylpyrimidine/phosphomethylpyrimidine kinase